MGLRTICAAAVCKASYGLLRALGRGGTSLPGKLALKVDPNYLSTLARQVKTIVITGTNGKTTSTHIVAQALENTGQGAFYNRSGANLIQGVTTEFAIRSSITGRPHEALACIECDEGALRRVCAALDPAVVVVTNVFRDQLDRYGEVMHTRDNILAGLKNSPHALVCLNADDSIVASMARELQNEVMFYGVGCEVYPTRVEDPSDATHCIRCGNAYEYEYRTYGHLGGFRCPECGFARPVPSVEVRSITDRTSSSCTLSMVVNGCEARVPVDVPAGYDVYNCVASIAGLLAFGFAADDAFAAVAKFKHGFGRAESFNVNGTPVRLMLMKNPAGCNQIINLLLNEPEERMGLVCILNDQECDGTDVSWIYDAAWESLCDAGNCAAFGRTDKGSLTTASAAPSPVRDDGTSQPRHPEQRDGEAVGASSKDPSQNASRSDAQTSLHITQVVCSGNRAEDMALRLKYAGVPVSGLFIVKSYDELIARLGRIGHSVTVVANYSAMLEFRAALAEKLGLAGFWEG